MTFSAEQKQRMQAAAGIRPKADKLTDALTTGLAAQNTEASYDDQYTEMCKLRPSWKDPEVAQQEIEVMQARGEQLGYSRQRISDMSPKGINQMAKDMDRDQRLHNEDMSLNRARIKVGRQQGSMDNLNKTDVIAEFLMDLNKQG